MTDDPPHLDPETRTALLEAEVAYQTARAELAACEHSRYLHVHRAFTAIRCDARALLADTPPSITRATLAGAIRRHAAPADWAQLAFDLESAQHPSLPAGEDDPT
jgi:hypothetical protein